MSVDAGKFDLTGRIAMVTGAGQGFGRTFCQGLAEYGATPVVLDLDLDKAEETVSLLHGGGYGSAYAVQADVSVAEQVQAAFDTVKEKSGQLDVLVNNAGLW